MVTASADRTGNSSSLLPVSQTCTMCFPWFTQMWTDTCII